MAETGDSAPIWHRVGTKPVHWWIRLDSDWKSVICGIAIISLIIGFDVPVTK